VGQRGTNRRQNGVNYKESSSEELLEDSGLDGSRFTASDESSEGDWETVAASEGSSTELESSGLDTPASTESSEESMLEWETSDSPDSKSEGIDSEDANFESD